MKGFLVAGTFAFATMIAFPSVSTGQTPPPIGGGYTGVIAIPSERSRNQGHWPAAVSTRRRRPVPAVIYRPGCGGIDPPMPRAVQKTLVDRTCSPKAWPS